MESHWAGFLLVYLDTPLAVIEERRAANSRTRARGSVPDGNIRTDIALLEPPDDGERAIYVSPGYVLPEILAAVSARLKGTR